ncbi:hypothetical protein PFISCL1PPCAC_10012, partial [Pristionchus fissidentatus]
STRLVDSTGTLLYNGRKQCSTVSGEHVDTLTRASQSMGVQSEGVENDSAIMDHMYTERSNSRSRDHAVRRNNEEKNHRAPGDDGPNGTRAVPVEKPLQLIINRNDAFENGHSYPSKNSYNHLLQEDFTKSALNVVHGRPSTTPISFNSAPSTSSSAHNSPFTSPPHNFGRMTGRQEEAMKRKDVVVKLEKMKEQGKLDLFITQLEATTPNQIALSVRRHAKNATSMPGAIKSLILDGMDASPPSLAPRGRESSKNEAVKKKGDDDEEPTEYDDLNEIDMAAPSSSSPQWLMEQAKLIAVDTRLGYAIADNEEKMRNLEKKLRELETADRESLDSMIESSSSGMGEEEGGCARLIAWTRRERRPLMRRDEYLLNEVPSTSREGRDLTHPPCFVDQSNQYLHRLAVMSGMHIRKNKKKSIWLNTREMEEEKARNGMRKKEEKEKREKKKMERAVKEEVDEEKSDSYEDTDDDDDDEKIPVAATPEPSKKNGTTKERERKRPKKVDRKRSRRSVETSYYQPLSIRKISARRGSQDVRLDFDILHMPTRLPDLSPGAVYQEIEVPPFKIRRVAPEPNPQEQDFEEFGTKNLMARIARQHHALEFEEKQRFSAMRREDARKMAAMAAAHAARANQNAAEDQRRKMEGREMRAASREESDEEEEVEMEEEDEEEEEHEQEGEEEEGEEEMKDEEEGEDEHEQEEEEKEEEEEEEEEGDESPPLPIDCSHR